MTYPSRGFALIISVILTSVSLAIGLALLDVAYKQLLVSTTAKQSGIAFYNADGAMECALYNDQKLNAFTVPAASNAVCDGSNDHITAAYNAVTFTYTYTFTVPCSSGGTQAAVSVYKNISTAATTIFASGYNTCNASDPRRVERGVKINY